jgi:hypothetical protein
VTIELPHLRWAIVVAQLQSLRQAVEALNLDGQRRSANRYSGRLCQWSTAAGAERNRPEAVNPSDWGPFDTLHRFRCKMAGTIFPQIQSNWRY